MTGSGVRYVWHEARVPDGLEITQVYGYLLCPRTGRDLVQDDDGVFNLPGGTPEPEDGGDLVATLVREAFEGNQVRVGATAYLGYQEVYRPGRAVYAQVRMAGVIEEFAPRAPDPDGGRVYRRRTESARDNHDEFLDRRDFRRDSRSTGRCPRPGSAVARPGTADTSAADTPSVTNAIRACVTSMPKYSATRPPHR